MAGRTDRFGFNYFGGNVPGSINEDEQKFTGVDRISMDRQLRLIEAHDYRHRPAAAAISEDPPTAITASGGRLQGGQTLFYRVATLGEDGLETGAGPELTVVLPSLLAPPLPLSSAVNEQDPLPTGTLTAGFYQYALTALRGTEETTLGPVLSVTVPAGAGAVRLALPGFGDADSVRLWRLGEADAGYTRVALIPEGTTTFVDDGSVVADPCACDPANLPPQFNVGATYAVEITLPLDAVVGTGWRLYRSTTSGRYSSSSLVHQVVEVEDELVVDSPVVRSWIDLGDELGLGAPRDGRLDIRMRPFTFDTAAALPDPAGYPEAYPFLLDGVLHVLAEGAWVAVSGGSGGGGGGGAIVTSPNGKRWFQTVSDTGTIVMVETTFPGPPAPVQNVQVS